MDENINDIGENTQFFSGVQATLEVTLLVRWSVTQFFGPSVTLYLEGCSGQIVFLVAKSNSIRGFVRRSIRPSVVPSVGPSRISQKPQIQENSTKFE